MSFEEELTKAERYLARVLELLESKDYHDSIEKTTINN